MKLLKQTLLLFTIGLFFWACGSSPLNNKTTTKEKPVVIANDSLEYQIIILDLGFNTFLNSIAQPKGYYSQEYLEARNRVWVLEWNNRARNTSQFNTTDIYENIIEYQPSTNYGYEVNYKLFNYFLFAQRKYKMSLGGGFRTNRIN